MERIQLTALALLCTLEAAESAVGNRVDALDGAIISVRDQEG